MWPRSHLLTFPALLAAAAVMACGPDTPPLAPASPLYRQAQRIGNLFPFEDPRGKRANYSTTGSLDISNPFFQSLGTNGRSCGSCHLASDAFGLSAASAQSRFGSPGGTDPLFAAFDGANCPNAAPGDAGARSLLLSRGLIRVALPLPANAQFTVAAVHDPYGCALVVDPQGIATASMYRRPLPTTNLRLLRAVMVDGRETPTPLNTKQRMQANQRLDIPHPA